MLDQQLAKEAAMGLGLTEDEAEDAIEDFESPMGGFESRLGTYSTIDCPTEKVDKALNWLKKEFAKIDGIVRKISNPHDFGNYSSFEVDYPKEIEVIELRDDDISDNEKALSDYDKKDNWHDKANEIEEKYFNKFDQWL